MRPNLAMAWLLLVALSGCGMKRPSPGSDEDLCATYCALAALHCRNAMLLYRSPDACAAACATFPQDDDPTASRGDSLQCRLTYLKLAATNPLAFCLNGGADGGAQCR